MESKILNKEFVIENGLECEKLYCDCNKYGDREFEINKEDKELMFSGISYTLYENGNLDFYCNYKDGFKEGEYVEFYKDGQLMKRQIMKHGKTNGKREEWYPSGLIKRISEYRYGICLSYTEWDENGNIIDEKKEPTEGEMVLIRKFESMNYE